jgi:hypothetical protein
VANLVVLPLDGSGQARLTVSGSGTVHVVLDVQGYLLP